MMETLQPCENARQSLIGFTKSAFAPSSRFRFIQFIPHLEKAGWRVRHCPNRPDRNWHSHFSTRLGRALHHRIGSMLMKVNRLRDIQDAKAFDVAFVNRSLAGEGMFFEKRLLRCNPRAVFDFDDAIFTGRSERTVQWMCANAAWVTPGNNYLAEYARHHSNHVTVIPTVIDTDEYLVKSPESNGAAEVVRVGWSGSDWSIGPTLIPHLRVLAAVQAKCDFELIVITNTKPELPVPGLRWRFIPWRSDDELTLAKRFEIGIMPLKDDAFQRGKCGLKLLQYMAAGLPVVASPVGVNEQIIRPGLNGFRATSESEWYQALTTLIQQRQLRMSMGATGRQICEAEYSIRKWFPELVRILENVSRSTRVGKGPPAGGNADTY